ncbi:SKA complex subunit 3 [Salminus brasiliensis]|uniref:SKA complex subunit 3 n=1 Tax=Salminus brasiliensis TaxID=930266 RepID=UPI003B834849
MASMDTSIRFFAKLRSLAVRLETERANLEHTASQKLDEEDEDTESGAVRALHELHSEVRGFKKLVQGQVASQDDGCGELRSFIKTCMVLKQRTTEDIERIKNHYEKYGYKPRKAFQKNSEVNGHCEAQIKLILEEQPEREPAGEVSGDGNEEVQVQESAEEPETPEKMPPPAVDQMRTPQLADFGLSALHLQMVLCNVEQSREVAPVPAVALTPPPFIMPMEPSQPKTPRCSLIMDEDAPTPRLEDFGITEHTMCLNNDFTMDLFRKKPPRGRPTHSATEETAQGPQNLPTPPSFMPHEKISNESMESPELPAFCSLELKMNKPLPSSSALPSSPSSPTHTSNTACTPPLPTFETPFISKLISARKETRQNEQDGLGGSLNSMPNPLECPAVRGSSSDMPQMPVRLCPKEETTPEMPKLQSFSLSLPCMGGGTRSGITEPQPPVLHANDDHTEDWCLATPRVRMDFQVEPRTPEMPDMSSITQDILKLVSQAKSKPHSTSSVQQSSKASLQTSALGKENRAQRLDHVSEREFNGLASYMKQIPLASLNLAINKINQVVEERRRDGDLNSEAFHMEDLRKILEVGPQSPMYILAFVELKRLESVQGRTATFRIITKT